MKYQRSKNLDDKLIEQVVEILDGWTGPLSWNALLVQVESRLQQSYTRQTLYKHERIRLAFALRKKALATGQASDPKKVANPVLQTALDRISRLEAENERLKVENANLLEQFMRWTYNASTRGLGIDFLNQALPHVDKGSTEPKQRKSRN